MTTAPDGITPSGQPRRSLAVFNHWFYYHGTSPREVARQHRPRLRATTLIDQLIGKGLMQDNDDVLLAWEAACDGVRTIRNPDPCIYCWRNHFYRWPDLPMTVAGQQANFSYPAFLAIRAVDAMHAYGDPCYCRVVAWVEDLWSYHRTGPPEFDAVVINKSPAMPGRPPLQMLDAFHREYWHDDPNALRARINADPGRAVADYLSWHLARLTHPRRPAGFLRGPESPPEWVLRL